MRKGQTKAAVVRCSAIKLISAVTSAALVALEVKWLAHYLGDALVAIAVTGLALVNAAALARTRHTARTD
ncbi:hypothetical protein [Sphingomonas quercus]|uniref:Phosphatase PAP2 family protein n=1 Tax=Sphingomonas quercus TaxID=2842451 RepID=A0ABS6BNJ4_9SPHN|nr:hypothetical protein [Sphingomonas quercus]MBU3078819.1 hypothetical protein [Sphingomonas quercus]